jgi:Fervidolysin N-terminal prodomain
MNTNDITGNTEHDEIAVLLPWYVNGSLNTEERILVDDHVRRCLTCRRELALERRTLEVFHSESPVDQSADAAFERLHDRIAGRVGRPGRSRYDDLVLALRRLRTIAASRAWSGLRLPLIALPMVALVFGLVLVNLEPDDAQLTGGSGLGGYRTLSQADSIAAHIEDIHVIFARGTDSARIAQILQSLDATIVGGPNSAGAYSVRLSGVKDAREREAAIAALRNQREVVFAEPAQPLAVPEPRGNAPQ